MTLHAQVRQQVTAQLAASSDDPASLNNALRLLSKWRSVADWGQADWGQVLQQRGSYLRGFRVRSCTNATDPTS